MFSNYDIDKSKNKVYINPNFNRPQVNNHPMHVNPRFTRFLSNVHPDFNNKTNIHVNPNFMKSQSTSEVIKVDNTSMFSVQPHTISNGSKHLCIDEKHNIEDQKLTVSLPVTNSRYCLVRQNIDTQLQMFEELPLNKPKITFQLNKYKSIPLKDIKRNLDGAKTVPNKQKTVVQAPQINRLNTRCSLTDSIKQNKFKLVNNKNQVTNSKNRTRTFSDTHKRVLISQPKLNKSKRSLKKNNIPCPMFRKFGKCLRKENGTCDFLHDKKHVFICRKFVKGRCHDADCLLSHDLTTKKMPTCYFYLQGTCTKSDCPYLHVKLNDKVKVCSDFLKGYCEKGSSCLQRHTNVYAGKKVRETLVPKSSTNLRKKNCKLKIKKQDLMTSSISTVSVGNLPFKEENESNLDRYYQENKGDVSATNETFEVIKPQRCKLGALPSFIQLKFV